MGFKHERRQYSYQHNMKQNTNNYQKINEEIKINNEMD